MTVLRQAEKPSPDYAHAVETVIRRVMIRFHERNGKKIHRVGIESKVQAEITKQMSRREWPFRKAPLDTTVFRILNYMANEGSLVQYVPPKRSGWYKVNPDKTKWENRVFEGETQ